MKKLNNEFGLSDNDLNKIINDAEQNFQKDLGETIDEEEVKRYNERRKEIADLKESLKLAKDMKNKDWATQIIKQSVSNAIITQTLSQQDIEDDFRSSKVESMAALTTAIASSAKAIMDIEHSEQNLDIQREKNSIRLKEIDGKGGPVLTSGKDGTVAIGTGKDILAMLEKGLDPTKTDG